MILSNDVSVAKIDRILNDISSHTILRHSTLPNSMNWDEFKATKGKMAFIIVNNETGNIFDIQDSRNERNKVKLITTDFYSGYIFLTKKLFKNADIVIDRFHLVTQVYVALNSTRIQLCKKDNPNYNKHKDLWKLIVKNENDLSEAKYYSKHFKKEISQKDMVTYMINTDKTLKVAYELTPLKIMILINLNQLLNTQTRIYQIK